MVPTEGAASDVWQRIQMYIPLIGVGRKWRAMYEQYYNSPQNHSGWGHVNHN